MCTECTYTDTQSESSYVLVHSPEVGRGKATATLGAENAGQVSQLLPLRVCMSRKPESRVQLDLKPATLRQNRSLFRTITWHGMASCFKTVC